MNKLTNQLKSLKTSPHAGWAEDARRVSARAMLMEAIGHDDARDFAFGNGRAAYLRWVFSDVISKPLFAGAAVFALLLGGWMTTVSAASNSLPGDALYNVKIVTEKAKLKLASMEHRALLHTEFAQERLSEALTLAQSEDPARKAHAQTAMDAFRSEVALASDNLRQLKSSGSEQTVQVANQLDQKIDELSSKIGTITQDEQEEALAVGDAIEAAQVASDGVVDVVVESHEESATEMSQRSLDALFKKELMAVQGQEAYLLGRIAVIRSTFESNPELAQALDFTLGDLKDLENAIVEATSPLPDAMDLFAVGGIRMAFVNVRTAARLLSEIETQIAELEISVTTAFQEQRLLTQTDTQTQNQ